WGIEYSTWRTWTNSPTEYDSTGKQTGGWTREWFRRHFYHAWAGGAIIGFQEATDVHTGADSSGLNPIGREIAACGLFFDSHTRGKPVVPFAIVHDHYSGFEPKFGAYMQGDAKWYDALPYTTADARLNNL